MLKLKPETQARLEARAAARQMPVEQYLESVIEQAAKSAGTGDPALALFAQWQIEDATDDQHSAY